MEEAEGYVCRPLWNRELSKKYVHAKLSLGLDTQAKAGKESSQGNGVSVSP